MSARRGDDAGARAADACAWVIGVDAGASLTKCVARALPATANAADGEPARRAALENFAAREAAAGPAARAASIRWGAGAAACTGRVRMFPRSETRALLAWINAFAPARIGLTGGGGAALASELRARSEHFGEFDAWAAGAGALLARSGRAPAHPYLLVSVGTGTSAIRVTPAAAERAGGCALGGGTLLGLGRLLTGADDFGEITALATSGDRTRGVDLEVADIYPALPRGYTAANFGGAGAIAGHTLRREDLAHALAVLVGENVALVCCALARSEDISQLVFGGATLRQNPALWNIIESITEVRGLKALRLEDGEYAGALGALTLASARTSGAQ